MNPAANPQTKNIPLQTRLAVLEAESEDRVFNVIFTTGAVVRKYNFFADEAYDEELVVAPLPCAWAG